MRDRNKFPSFRLQQQLTAKIFKFLKLSTAPGDVLIERSILLLLIEQVSGGISGEELLVYLENTGNLILAQHDEQGSFYILLPFLCMYIFNSSPNFPFLHAEVLVEWVTSSYGVRLNPVLVDEALYKLSG